MHKIKLLFAAALLATSMMMQAAGPTLDIANELEARTVTLPTSEPGTVVVKGCTGCATFRLQTTADTEYLIGRERVTLARLRAAFAASPGALILLKVSSDRREVTEVYISSFDGIAR